VAEADADRFTRIYRTTYPRVLGYAMRRASPEAAREAAAEAFLVAWRRLADVPDPALPWLLVVTRNVIADQRRGGRRADAVLAEVERLMTMSHHPDLSDEVVERSVVVQAVAALAETDREALMLTVWDGLGHRAAAKVAGCSIGAFAVRVHRARRRLSAELDRLDGSGVPVAPNVRMEAG
jgi:RNA polymerase sigma-70 factor, ECF subfamily